MSLRDWLLAFRAQHEEARAGRLSAAGWAAYRAARDELARAMLAAQRAALRPGEVPRQQLRVARAMQADLEWSIDRVRAVTLDVSSGGIAVLLSRAPPKDEEIRVQLKVPGGEPVKARARLAGVQQQPSNVRVALAFSEISEADRDRIELAVFDTVIQQLKL